MICFIIYPVSMVWSEKQPYEMVDLLPLNNDNIQSNILILGFEIKNLRKEIKELRKEIKTLEEELEKTQEEIS